MNKTEYEDVKLNLIKKSLEKDKTEVFVPIERRKKEDGRLSFVNLMCFFMWGVVVAVLAMIAKAGKSIGFIVNNDLIGMPLEFWNKELLKISLVVNIFCFLICTICIILNFTRHKRRTDKIRKSLCLCDITCFLIGLFLILKLY